MVFSFKRFVEKELGKFPHFLIYAVLEWTLIIILFLDGFLAFIANQFAKLFELKVPCLLCTRVDHVLVRRNPDFYYNDSICIAHKKNVSTLAFCHVHKKLSNIKKMCERCIISFATEKESGCDMYKSLVGILHQDIEMISDEDQLLDNQPPKNSNSSSGQQRPTIDQRCRCCGEPLKVRSFNKTKSVSFFSTAAAAPSPRAPYPSFKNHRETIRNFSLDFTNLESTELKLMENDEYDHRTNLAMLREEQEGKTPSAMRGNRFFGIPLTDSPSVTPRLASRLGRKSMLERTEFASASDSSAVSARSDQIKRQINKEQRSLIELYMDFDEERHASEVAAKNAMAMITRLQAEKAAVRMEALQYQRLMEEQAEYDQEAFQALHEMLLKREEEMRELEVEVEAYRAKYGCLEEFEVQADEKQVEGFRVVRPPSFTKSSSSQLLGSPEYGSPMAAIEEEPPPPPATVVVKSEGEEKESSGGFSSSSEMAQKMLQQQIERSRFLGRLRNLDKKLEIADNRESGSDED